MAEQQTCQESVAYGSGYHFRICNRPVKEEGLCGLHLAAKRRREARMAQADREWEEKKAQDARLKELGVRFWDKAEVIRVIEEYQAAYDAEVK